MRKLLSGLLRIFPWLAFSAALVIGGFWAHDYFAADQAAVESHSRQVEELEERWEESDSADPVVDPDHTPVADTVDYGVTYASLRIPRFDTPEEEYKKPIMEGAGRDVLDVLGVGHYPETANFGEVGNVGLAGHRNGYGAIFEGIQNLQKGDKIYVDTKDGTYTYIYDWQEHRDPSAVEVLLPVPNEPGAKPTEQLLTLTTCEWWDPTGRVIAYAHFDSFEQKGA